MSFSNRVAIISGAGSGIGLAIAKRLLCAGIRVIFVGRKEINLREIIESSYLPHCHSLMGDASAEDEVAKIFQSAVEIFGAFDVLVNCAGHQDARSLLEISSDRWDEVMANNARSVFLMTQGAAHYMRSIGGGSIVNVASVRATRPGLGMAHYSASKAAVVALTKSAAAELGPTGIRVNAISPGLVDRPGLRNEWPEGVAAFERIAPLGCVGSAADVAEACYFLISPAAKWITGVNLFVDGGISLVR